MKGKGKARPDVKVRKIGSWQDILQRMKREVLKGCHIVFSGLIPVNQEPETYVLPSHSSATIWTMAEDFGAKCHRDLVKNVTHMVAANVCICD